MKDWFRDMKARFRDMKDWFRDMEVFFRDMKAKDKGHVVKEQQNLPPPPSKIDKNGPNLMKFSTHT